MINSSMFAAPRVGARTWRIIGAVALTVSLMSATSAQAARTWKPTENLSQSTNYSTGSDIAVAPSGEAVSVMYRYNSGFTSSDIIYAVRQPGGPWAPAKTLTATADN